MAEENNVDYKPAKRGARLDRLAALASTINNWEDDLSHPTLSNSKVLMNLLYLKDFFFDKNDILSNLQI